MAGAGAIEVELSKEIASFGEKCPGLAQYAIQKFSESLDELPRALAANAGLKVTKRRNTIFNLQQVSSPNFGNMPIENFSDVLFSC